MYRNTRLDTAIGSNEPLARGKGILYTTKLGQVVYSPNAKRKVELPTMAVAHNKAIKRDATMDNPEEFCNPLWWSEETAFLAFFPTKPRFNREPFNDVFYLPSWIRLTGRRGISSGNLIGWRRTELKVNGMINCLLFKYDIPKPLEIIDTPICCSGVFKEAAYYKFIVKRSRRWFSLLYAQLAFTIAVAITRDDEHDTVVMPTWYNYLAAKAGGDWDVPCLWGVYESAATFLDVRERSGVFINILTPPRHQVAAEWLISFRAPVYYTWNQEEMAAAQTSDFVKKHAPPIDMVQDLHTFILKPPLPAPSSHAELIEAFMEERMRRTSDAIRFETDSEKEERVEREMHPHIARATVYVWDVDDNGDFRRILAPKVRNATILEYFREIQGASYNAIFNEWDCWDGSSAIDNYSQHYCATYPDGNFQNALLEESSVIKGMAIQNLHELPKDSETTLLKNIDLASVYTDYHGFHPVGAFGDQRINIDGVTESDMVLISALAGKWWAEDRTIDVSGSTCDLLNRFKNFVLSNTGTTNSLEFGDLCDLLPTNANYVGNSPRIHMFRRVQNNDTMWYMLDFGDSATVPWMLAVCSAVDVLFLCRFKPHHVDYELGRELLARGARFRTLSSIITESYLLSPARKLPYRDSSYKFTLRDYEAYLTDRTNLLSNPCAQRAALMEGGIIWRLSQTSCSAHKVFEGPSTDIHHGDARIIYHRHDNSKYWDDLLTERDMDIICGAYDCKTGKL